MGWNRSSPLEGTNTKTTPSPVILFSAQYPNTNCKRSSWIPQGVPLPLFLTDEYPRLFIWEYPPPRRGQGCRQPSCRKRSGNVTSTFCFLVRVIGVLVLYVHSVGQWSIWSKIIIIQKLLLSKKDNWNCITWIIDCFLLLLLFYIWLSKLSS